MILKQENPDKLTSKVEYLVLGVVFIALCVARWGDIIFYSKKNVNQDLLSKIVPVTLKPYVGFVGPHQLSLPLGILGIIVGVWLFNRFVLKDSDFFYLLDQIVIASCLAWGHCCFYPILLALILWVGPRMQQMELSSYDRLQMD
ncbi:MAG: hypothetical protein IPP42_01495 [Saprospiraceae bacterium]|nr:hypothetical protein [Saprospiraceae bacterium]